MGFTSVLAALPESDSIRSQSGANVRPPVRMQTGIRRGQKKMHQSRVVGRGWSTASLPHRQFPLPALLTWGERRAGPNTCDPGQQLIP